MPQNALQATISTVGGVSKPSKADLQGDLLTAQGALAALNLAAASTTVIKASPGRLVKISVIVAGSAAGAAYDQATTTSPTVATQVAVIPNTVGIYPLDWPCTTGILIVAGTGQALAVSYT